MFDESEPSSPTSALVALAPLDPDWQPILHVSNQVVLYNPTSHALSIRTHSRSPTPVLSHRDAGERCPYCHRSFSSNDDHDVDEDIDRDRPRSRAPNYFQLLEIANESSRPASPTRATGSGPSSRRTVGTNASANMGQGAFRAENMAEGYFKAFFKEEYRIGMGANGSVFLCQHVLDGNDLGHFAVKKIAVGQSHSYLLDTLREVRLLEKLHHRNIVTYHHAWLETCQFSSFGPKIPTLHVLMQWAEGGSLDDLIDARLGRRAPQIPHLHTSASPLGAGSVPSPQPPETTPTATPYSRSARIRAFRTLQHAPPADRERLRREMGLDGEGARGGKKAPDWKAVHLLSAEEVKSLFSDVVAGLAFLHDKSILHLDLKPGNVLLTWDEGQLIPRAMLSDFGTSQDMLNSRMRTGNTGTLEYAAPESLPSPSTGLLLQVDSKADMWSLGMILHKLLFFRLPYRHASDSDDGTSGRRDQKEVSDQLEREVASYPGFKSSPLLYTTFTSRRLPRAYLFLLETLLNIKPSSRPSSERVLNVIREGRLDPLPEDPTQSSTSGNSLVPIQRRHSFDAGHEESTPDVVAGDHDAHISEQGELELDGDSALLREKRTEGTPFLRLPAPSSPALVWEQAVNVYGRQIHMKISRVLWTRTIKSCVLVAKVLSLSRVCPDTRPHALVSGAILIPAIMDTWFDGFTTTLILGLIHVVLLRLACWSLAT